MSLRTVHLAFILLATLGADLFGIWAVWRYLRADDPLLLGLGVVSILGGLGLTLYAARFVRKLDELKIR